MLKPSRMKKLRVATLKDHRYDLIKRLHELGVVQITDFGERIGSPEWSQLLTRSYGEPIVRKITSLIMSYGRILNLFQTVDPIAKEGLVKALFSPPPQKKISVEDICGEELINKAEKLLEGVTEDVSASEKEYHLLEEKISDLEELKTSVEKVKNLDIDLSYVGTSRFVSVFVGLISKDSCDRLVIETNEITKECVIDFRESSKEENAVVITVINEYADEVISSARKLGFEQQNVSKAKGKPSDAILAIESEIVRAKKERENVRQKLVESARRWRDEVEATQELLSIERERGDISSNFAETEETFVLEGWVEARRTEQVEKEILETTNGHAIVQTTEPDVSDDVPIKLDNPRFLRPFELLTKMYASPRYDEIDPTFLIGPVLAIYFGLMLGDAVYGLFILMIGCLLYRGAGKVSESLHDMSVILLAIGASTIVFGVLQGSYLGDFAPAFLGIDPPFRLLNPLKDPTQILRIALVIGIAHLNIGLLVAAYQNLQRKDYHSLLHGQMIWFIIQPCAAVLLFNFFGWTTLPFSLIVVAGVGAGVGILLLMLKEGPLGIFSLTGFLGNWLSYVRILALILATSGIAMTVNILTKMIAEIHPMAIFLAIFVCIFGHLFNFILNCIGAFVHSLRLHYVEFFSKFYVGGGRDFRPFKATRRYTELMKNTA